LIKKGEGWSVEWSGGVWIKDQKSTKNLYKAVKKIEVYLKIYVCLVSTDTVKLISLQYTTQP